MGSKSYVVRVWCWLSDWGLLGGERDETEARRGIGWDGC